MKTNPFVYYSSAHYTIPTFLSCFSLIKNYNSTIPLNINIIHNNLPDSSQNRFKSLETYWSQFKPVTISLIDVADIKKLDFKVMKNNLDFNINSSMCWGLDIETFFRMWLAEIIDSDYAFSLDADTLILEDISSVWDFNVDPDIYVMGCKHFTDRSAWYNEWLNGREGLYINSGVLLWNLKAIRDNNIIPQFEKEMQENPFLDQEIINRVCYGHIRELPIEYNAGTPMRKLKEPRLNFSQEDIDIIHNHPKIIHYTSKWKPWIGEVLDSDKYEKNLSEVYDTKLLTPEEYYQWRKTLQWPGVDKTRKVVD